MVKEAPAEASQDLIQTVVAAAEILRALEHMAAPVPLAAIARELGMTPPRIHRHLATLVALGFVERIGQEPLYALGLRLAQLGDRAVRQHDLVQIAYPFLKELRDTVGHAVALTRQVGDEALVWLCLESLDPPHLSLPPGTALSLHASSSGRILLAHMDAPTRERLLRGRLDPADLPDPITDKNLLAARLEDIRRVGYDVQGSTETGRMFGMAAPVYDHLGEVIASVSLIGVFGMASNSPSDLLAPLVTAANHISSSLGKER